jgi:mono/diheme cytochrome c family protein
MATAAEGEAILRQVCTACHGLEGLGVFADYWGEEEWRSLVDTMVSYGAVLDPADYPTLVRHLALRYGTMRADGP